MRRICCILVLTFCAVAAYGDSIPTYNLTQGTVTLASNDINTFTINWNFTNGTGANLSGQDSWGTCLDFAAGGSTCNPDVVIGLNQSGAQLNGLAVGIFGNVTISGADFLLPASGASFSITMPVLFSGAFETCPFVGPPNGGCTSQNTTSEFNINGTGTASLSFSGLNTANGNVWQFTSATYTLNAVPEPASIFLLGTGALAIVGRLRYRKN
jgi:hypothetical protein